MIVAYAAPITPNLKVKIKIGSKIMFKIFEPTIKIVGVFEFPSACNVSERKLLNKNIIEKTNKGREYSNIKSIDSVILIKTYIFPINKDIIKHNAHTMATTINP